MPTPQEKREASKARVTCDLKGSVKAKFFDEVLKTGIKESDLVREIITTYYEQKPERF
jgi:hypothetical protein